MTYVWMCKRNLAVAQHDVCVNVQEKLAVRSMTYVWMCKRNLAVAQHDVCVNVQEKLAVA